MAISDFALAFTVLIGNEGGYTVDNGGPTMYGVTQAVARRWGYTGDMKALPLATAHDIAKKQYWDPYQCDAMPTAIAFQVLDASYNGGHPAAWLQMAVGVVADGQIGEVTLTAVRAADPWKVLCIFNAMRLKYLASLKQPQYSGGRMNRIANNLLQGDLK